MIHFFKRKLTHNFIAKIVVIILAVAVWLMVKHEEDVAYQFNAMVEIKVADNMFLVDMAPSKVNLTLVGRRNSMDKLKNKDIVIQFDLRNKQKTQVIILPITRDKINVPPEVLIKKIEPVSVDVKMDKGIKKSMPVRVLSTDKPAPEYSVESISVTPSIVELFGPESVLKNHEFIETYPVSISGQKASFTQRVELKPFYAGLNNIPVVNVYVNITRSLRTRTLSPVDVQIIKSTFQSDNISVDPAEVSITVEGTESGLQTLKKENITVYVHITDLKDGKYEIPISTIIPEEFNVVSIKPEVAEVTIGRSKVTGQ